MEFLVSKKDSNVRIRKCDVKSYCIIDEPEDHNYVIQFLCYDSEVVQWTYDSKDVRDEVLQNVDRAVQCSADSHGMSSSKC